MRLILKLPLFLKVFIAFMMNALNLSRRMIIKRFINDNKNCEKFNKNNKLFIKTLKTFLNTNFYTKKEVADYLNWLYNDEINLVKPFSFKKNSPIILCVVKNDIIKIKKFIQHYKQLGFENFCFIDNDSNDGTFEFLISQDCCVYQVKEKYTTNRRISWIMNVKNVLPINEWIFLLDSDEFLVYSGCEKHKIREAITFFENSGIKLVSAVMIDMFSIVESNDLNDFEKTYIYFDNAFDNKKSYYFNSIYGGVRKRIFDSSTERKYLIKKHPVLKNSLDNLFCHSHYSFPYKENFKAKVYFGLLHYKFYENDIEKFKKIVEDKSYANGSAEYKNYVEILTSNKFEDIFTLGSCSLKYDDSSVLNNISVISNINFD